MESFPFAKRRGDEGVQKKKEEKKMWDKEKLANHIRDQEWIGHFQKHSSIAFEASL